MKDFKVINAKAILPIYKMQPIRGFAPTSVMLIGEKFDKLAELYYNGVTVKEFIIQSANRLIARVPDSQLGRPFRDVVAYADVSIARMDAAIQLGMTKPIKMVEGVDRLVQTWLLVFLSTPGTDIFSPTSGGGGRALIGKSTDRNHGGVSAKLAFAIERTNGEILRSQATQTGLPPAERLLSCGLDSVEFNSSDSILNARITMSNVLGDRAQVNVG